MGLRFFEELALVGYLVEGAVYGLGGWVWLGCYVVAVALHLDIVVPGDH